MNHSKGGNRYMTAKQSKVYKDWDRNSEKKARKEEREKRRAKRRGMTLGKRKRNWFTFFLIVIFIIIYVLCVGVLNYLNFHNYITFSFECYWCALGFMGVTGVLIGLFLSINYLGRKKRTHRPEKKTIYPSFLFLRFLLPTLLFLVIGILFAKGFISMEYFSF